MKLTLAENLKLPLDAITQTFLVVGKRGSGKSNTAARMVEQFHHAKLPFVVLDPTDTWWGLKATADGGKGLDVYVFGGRKFDLPLDAGSGALIAEVLCEHRISMVLSVKHLSGRERSRFMVAFAQTLFQKWGGGPLHVVLEEAHELAPQMAGGRGGGNEDNEAAMLGAFKRLWKLGRSQGIGGTAVTQRPASLSKDITTQSEILVAHRTIGPQDVAAIGQWVKYHGQHEQILGDLPSLPTGEAFIWAPEFPEGEPLGLKRITVLRRDTFDSASTPKVGETRVDPKELAPVDLDRLRTKMASTIEKAKADDPRELRKHIADLRKQLVSKVDTPSAQVQKRTEVEKLILTDADRALLEKVATAISHRGHLALTVIADAETRLDQLVEAAAAEYLNTTRNVAMDAAANVATVLDRVGLQRVLEKLDRVTVAPAAPDIRQSVVSHPKSHPLTQTAEVRRHKSDGTRPIAESRQPINGHAVLGKCERSILTVLAQHPDGCEAGKITLLARYRYSGGFKNSLSALRQAGLMVGDNTGVMRITEAGLTTIGDVPDLPTGSELAAYWLTHQSFGKCERAILGALLEHPKGLTADQLCELTNYQYSGGFKNSLTVLRTAGVLVGKNTEVMRANEDLIEA